MPQLKYNFLGMAPNSSHARLEKVSDFQLFGRPRGIEFEADAAECRDIYEYAEWCEREKRDLGNSAHNKREMGKALQAIADSTRGL